MTDGEIAVLEAEAQAFNDAKKREVVRTALEQTLEKIAYCTAALTQATDAHERLKESIKLGTFNYFAI